MKILHVIDSEGFYGAETVLIDLAAEQGRNGVQATILNMRPCPVGDQSLEAEARKQGLEFAIIPLKSGLDIIGAKRIVHYARNNHFDIIHSHGYKANILLGLMPGWLRKLPIVTTLHGWCSTKKFTKLWLFEQLDRVSLKFMDAVVVVNKSMTTHPYLQNRQMKIQVVNNGIPEINFDTSCLEPRIKKFCAHGFILGAIGRLSKEKGFDNLIVALSLLRKKEISVRLVIIGEGPERENLEQEIKKYDLQQYVCLAGYQQTAKNYLKLFDMFVMPSLTEGLPITLLEAMQAQVPIVASNVGGIPYIIKHEESGFLFPKQSIEDLIVCICNCINQNELSKEMTATAYEKVMKHYSSKVMSQSYLEIYSKINMKVQR